MKYMTPELMSRFQGDGADAEAAVREWEENGDRYRSRLEEIDLPPAARALSGVYLHDAAVECIEVGQSLVTLCLRQEYRGAADKPVTELHLLRYETPGPVVVVRHRGAVFAAAVRDWLYDEFDSENGVFVHRILLSTGDEYAVPFRSLAWTRATATAEVE